MLAVAGTHPRVDPERIGGIGISRGAEASIFAALDRFRDMHGPEEGLEFWNTDRCVEGGASVGYVEAASRQAHNDLAELLDRVFALERPTAKAR